jgi:C1A family cysteine protease
MERKRNTRFGAAVILTAAFFLLVSAALVQADPREIDQIRQAIKAKGAKWHADETDVSKLTWRERKMRLGAKGEEEFAAELISTTDTAPIPTVEGVAASMDWRNTGGINFVSPVKNQGSCGSCWAFATTAGLESQVMIATGGQPIDLSEQVLLSCSGAGGCDGGSPTLASYYLRDVGLPTEACFQYTASNNICSNACLDWQNNAYTIKGWHPARTSTSLTVDDLRNSLYAYGPVIVTMKVYNDFFSYRSGVYTYTTGAYVGSHAVLVVGYDDARQAFIVKNSWGSGWGEAGYFMISYGELGGITNFGSSTWVYDGYGDAPPPPPPPSPEPNACTYALSASGATFKAGGGGGGFSVYVEGICQSATLAPVSSASWVSASSTSSAEGIVSISYTVAVNTGAARTATISIAGLNYIINQQKAVITGKKK